MSTHSARNLFLTFALLSLPACAHSYYYLPEIEGDGATHGKKGGVVYVIPPTGPAELTMRVRALGIKKAHGVQMLGVRMSFVRPPGAARLPPGSKEFLDPAEQTIRFGGGKALKPAFAHSKVKAQPIIALGGGTNEVIELLYPLPPESEGAEVISSYYFEWNVHYGSGKKEHQIARFDRYDARPQHAAELFPEDSDYPYDISPVDVPGWEIVRDPFWWSVDPLWPAG